MTDPNTIGTVFINSRDMPQSLVEEQNIPKTKSKSIHGLTGIVNTTNTCYMNSAIQTFSHIYPLTNFFFKQKDKIIQTLKNNARIIFKDTNAFKIENTNSFVPEELRKKIQNPNYSASMLMGDEETIILNSTMTFQLIKLLECMWMKNCVILPTSFRTVFSEARNKFFFGCQQHDAEEAYSCILQKIQEELAEKKNIKFTTKRQSVQEFLQFKNNITSQLNSTNDEQTQKKLLDVYKQKKLEMPEESLIIEAYREMQNYYSNTYNRITEIFSGFLHSSTRCPEPNCKFSSNKFDPFLHLSLPMPERQNIFTGRMPNESGPLNKPLTIQDCMAEFCKEEILDENNLWACEGCNKKVRAIKKLQVWTCPPVLVIQFKRFGITRITKDSRKIDYPTSDFDISSLISPVQIDSSKCYKYTLQCVINHMGSLHGGHYFAYCKDEDTGKWFNFDDTLVTEIATSAVVSQNAYLLFYMRQDMLNI